MRRPDSDSSVVTSWYTARDPLQAQLLSNPDSVRFLEPFLARERTVSEAATEVGCEVDAMHYRVRKFLEAGLLVVFRVQPRAGRPIKHYRSVADAFFVPFSATHFASLEEHVAVQLEPINRRVTRGIARLLAESGHEGRRIYRTDSGEVWNDAASGILDPLSMNSAAVPAAYDFSIGLQLEEAEARQLQGELHSLFERYARRERSRGKRYLWRMTLLPD